MPLDLFVLGADSWRALSEILTNSYRYIQKLYLHGPTTAELNGMCSLQDYEQKKTPTDGQFNIGYTVRSGNTRSINAQTTTNT